jgi:predicted amidophosphoribosyltransferase
MLEEILALIAPPACAVCGAGCELRRRVCERCDAALRRLPPVRSAVPGLDEVWSAAPYEGAARHLIGALKFGSRLGLAEEAASLIAGRLPGELLDGTIVPVPPAPLRRRHRGFDSAEAIAAALARRTALPLVPCLGRSQSPRQVGRRRAERLADPPRVRPVSPAPERALLVDDVITTGATLAACAEALREAGASSVAAVTLAASQPSRRGLGESPLAA